MEHARKMVIIPEDVAERVYTTANNAIYNSGGGGGRGAVATGNEETGAKPIVNKEIFTGEATASAPDTSLSNLDSVQTPGDEFSRLDEEMSKILNSQDYPDNNVKWKHFFQALQRYLFLIQKSRVKNNDFPNTTFSNNDQSTTDVAIDDSLPEKNIIISVPKKYTEQARQLVNFLKHNSNGQITWDKNGVVTINGTVIDQSSIIDLINDALRKRKTFNAVGKNQFASLLHAINVPRVFVGNEDFWISKTISTTVSNPKNLITPKGTVSLSSTSSSSSSANHKNNSVFSNDTQQQQQNSKKRKIPLDRKDALKAKSANFQKLNSETPLYDRSDVGQTGAGGFWLSLSI